MGATRPPTPIDAEGRIPRTTNAAKRAAYRLRKAERKRTAYVSNLNTGAVDTTMVSNNDVPMLGSTIESPNETSDLAAACFPPAQPCILPDSLASPPGAVVEDLGTTPMQLASSSDGGVCTGAASNVIPSSTFVSHHCFAHEPIASPQSFNVGDFVQVVDYDDPNIIGATCRVTKSNGKFIHIDIVELAPGMISSDDSLVIFCGDLVRITRKKGRGKRRKNATS